MCVCVCVLMLQMAHLNKIKSAEPEKLAELLSGKKTENVDPTEALQKAADDLIELKKNSLWSSSRRTWRRRRRMRRTSGTIRNEGPPR